VMIERSARAENYSCQSGEDRLTPMKRPDKNAVQHPPQTIYAEKVAKGLFVRGQPQRATHHQRCEDCRMPMTTEIRCQ